MIERVLAREIDCCSPPSPLQKPHRLGRSAGSFVRCPIRAVAGPDADVAGLFSSQYQCAGGKAGFARRHNSREMDAGGMMMTNLLMIPIILSEGHGCPVEVCEVWVVLGEPRRCRAWTCASVIVNTIAAQPGPTSGTRVRRTVSSSSTVVPGWWAKAYTIHRWLMPWLFFQRRPLSLRPGAVELQRRQDCQDPADDYHHECDHHRGAVRGRNGHPRERS